MARFSILLHLALLAALVLVFLTPSLASSPLPTRRLTTPSKPPPTSEVNYDDPTPLLSLSASPLLALETIPFLGLFSNPSSLAPGATVTLTWRCYFCSGVSPLATVTIVTNNSLGVVLNASLNGSTEFTVATSYKPTDTVTFTATVSDPTVPQYSLDLALHAPNPQITLSNPSYEQTVNQASGMFVAWKCTECYEPPTVTITWHNSLGSKSGTLANHVPVPDSGIVIPIPDDMVAQSQVYVRIVYDGEKTVSDENLVNVNKL